MVLYLSSYKLGNRQGILKEWIEKNGNNIVLITSARDAKVQDEIEKEKIEQNIKMLEDVGFKVVLVSLKEYFGKESRLKEEIRKYKAFCVIGGNVFVLRMAMKFSGLDNYLKEISKEHNYLYIGYSAGCCVLSPTLKGLELVDEPINPYNNKEVLYNGLNLIDYIFVPHYKSNHKESYLIDKVVEQFERNDVKYKALSDGDVIISNC